jgi:hypothetical protein
MGGLFVCAQSKRPAGDEPAGREGAKGNLNYFQVSAPKLAVHEASICFTMLSGKGT